MVRTFSALVFSASIVFFPIAGAWAQTPGTNLNGVDGSSDVHPGPSNRNRSSGDNVAPSSNPDDPGEARRPGTLTNNSAPPSGKKTQP